MPLFNEKVRKQLRDILQNMQDTVHLVYVTQGFECASCGDTQTFLDEISALNDKISLTVYDFVKDRSKADEYGVDKIPAIVFLDRDKNDTGIKFYGIPGGYEINSFIQALLETSGKKEELPDDILKRITAVDKDVHIQVFVTLSCPYCPAAVSTAHRLALENKKIRADMVESSSFIPLSQKYEVHGVPRIVINETNVLEGAHPFPSFLDVIEKL